MGRQGKNQNHRETKEVNTSLNPTLTQLNFAKIAKITALILITTLAAGLTAADSFMQTNWEENDWHNSTQDIEIEVTSFNDPDSGETRNLEQTMVELTGAGGETLSETVTRNDAIDPAEQEEGAWVNGETITVTFEDGEILSFDEGNWDIDITDDWEDGETVNENIGIYGEEFPEGSTQLDIVSATQDGEGEPVEVQWTSTNDYHINQELSGTRVALIDENGDEVRQFTSISDKIYANGDSETYNYQIEEEDYSNLESGDWDVEVTDYWTHETQETTTTVTADAPSLEVTPNTPTDGETITADEDQPELGINVDVTNEGSTEEFEFDIFVEDGVGGEQQETHYYGIEESETFTFDESITLSDLDLDETLYLELDITGQDSGVAHRHDPNFDVDTAEISNDLTINTPNNDDTITDENLTVEWTSTNNYESSKTLQETEIYLFEDDLTDEQTETASLDTSVSGNTDNTETQDIDISDLENGDYTLRLTDTWEDETTQQEITITVNQEETESFSTNIESVNYDDDEEEITVTREASNQGTNTHTLQDSEFEIIGDIGMLYSEDINLDTEISSSSTETNTYIISGSLNDGDYTIEAEDTWSTGQTSTDSYSFQVTEDGETQETDDNGEDDDTNGEDDDENGDDEDTDSDDSSDSDSDEDTNGDDETIQEAYSSETDSDADSDTEDTQETEETETDDECPEGFQYNEENDVCIETDDEQDGSVGALDSVTSPEVAGVPVWLITVLIAFIGIQFYWWKR